jgi:hypothetical protein
MLCLTYAMPSLAYYFLAFHCLWLALPSFAYDLPCLCLALAFLA